MTTDPIEAAAEALHLMRCPGCLEPIGHATPLDRDLAEVAVAAARPVIEAQVRAAVAAAIRAEWREECSGYTNLDVCQSCRAYDTAARIAEGTDR